MVTDEMLKRAIEAYAKETGAEDWQLDGWINSAIRAALEAALSAAEPVAWVYAPDLAKGSGGFGKDKGSVLMSLDGKWINVDTPLYAAPPAPSVAVKALDARSLAIDIVDGVKGYTLEFAQDQQAHEIDWDIAERKINDALSTQVQDVAGWQPIETAPKDGSEILALWKRSQIQSNGYGVVWFEDGSWHEFDYECLVSDPTHWMPLPAAPAKQEASNVTSQ